VKLTAPEVPENLGLKTALSQTMSPEGTDWLLKWVEKHTFLAHGVDVGVVDVVVLEGGRVVLVGGELDVVGGDVDVIKQEQADEMLDEAVVH
jgi:hypothetical protein